jgi:uncharacterized protein YjiS (DUF1127 family)
MASIGISMLPIEAVRIATRCILTLLVEAIMSTIFDPATDLRGLAGTNAVWIGHFVRRCWREFLRWQDEQAAIAQLSAMSDRELRDIGLNRSEIGFVVKGERPHDRCRAS